MRTNVLKISMKKEVKVLLFGKTSQAKKEIEALFHEVQINLENNYKDLAISARKQAKVKLPEYQAARALEAKDYTKLKEQPDEFTKRLEGYHH